MEKNIELGSEADLKIALVEGKVRIELGYGGDGGQAGAFVVLAPEYFLDKLAGAIPGKLDDAVIELLKGALKG